MDIPENIEFENCTHSPSEVARKIRNIEQFTALFDQFMNTGGKGWRSGLEVGKQLRTTHRTLQRLAIVFCLGLISGISEQEYTDARNETAIATAKKIKQMVEDGELPFGLYI